MSEKKEKFSYTKLDTYSKCPFQFKKKYEEKKRSSKRKMVLGITPNMTKKQTKKINILKALTN